MDGSGNITGWNRAAEPTFGWPSEKAIGRPLADTIVPERYREAHCGGIEKFLSTGKGPILNKRIELMAMHRDGREFPVEMTVSPVRVRGGFIFNAFMHDISERKQVEQEAVKLSAVTGTGNGRAGTRSPARCVSIRLLRHDARARARKRTRRRPARSRAAPHPPGASWGLVREADRDRVAPTAEGHHLRRRGRPGRAGRRAPAAKRSATSRSHSSEPASYILCGDVVQIPGQPTGSHGQAGREAAARRGNSIASGGETNPGRRGRNGGAFPGPVRQADLVALVHERGAGQREQQHRGGALVLAPDARRQPAEVVVGEHPGRARRCALPALRPPARTASGLATGACSSSNTKVRSRCSR